MFTNAGPVFAAYKHFYTAAAEGTAFTGKAFPGAFAEVGVVRPLRGVGDLGGDGEEEEEEVQYIAH
jgi:hypothetical protein